MQPPLCRPCKLSMTHTSLSLWPNKASHYHHPLLATGSGPGTGLCRKSLQKMLGLNRRGEEARCEKYMCRQVSEAHIDGCWRSALAQHHGVMYAQRWEQPQSQSKTHWNVTIHHYFYCSIARDVMLNMYIIVSSDDVNRPSGLQNM